MIVWLASYPRSGNTFLRMLLLSLYGWKTHAGYDPVFTSLEASETVGHVVLREPFETLEADDRVHFVKTHDLPQDDRPAIYLVRDGRDALVSFARYRLSFPQALPPARRAASVLRSLVGGDASFHAELRRLIEGRRPFGGWSRNVLAWTDGHRRSRTFAIRYEDLRADPRRWVQESLGGGVIVWKEKWYAPSSSATLRRSSQTGRRAPHVTCCGSSVRHSRSLLGRSRTGLININPSRSWLVVYRAR